MVAEIKTKVSTDVSDYNKKMDGVKAKASSVSQSTSKAFTGLGSTIAGAFAVGTVAAFSKSLMDAAGNVRDIADSLGITVSNLQAIRGVGLTTGQDSGKVDVILGKLERMKRAALDGNKEAAKSFSDLGIDMMTVAGPLDSLFEKVTRQSKALEGNNAALQAMSDIFGRSSALQQAFFDEISNGIDKAKEKLEGFNAVLGDEYINMLDEAGDKTDLFWASFKAWASIALAETIKGLENLFNRKKEIDNAWIKEEERARREAGGAGSPGGPVARVDDMEKINATKKAALEKEIRQLKEERSRLYENIATSDPMQGQAVQDRLIAAENALKDHNDAILKQKDSANQAEFKLMVEAAKKEQEENKKIYDAQLAQRKKADADALKQQEDVKRAREQLTQLAFDRDKVTRDKAAILRGEGLGTFQAQAANSLTRIGGMLGAQTSGMSEAARQTKIQEQMKKYLQDNVKSLYNLEKNTAETNTILREATS